jgi:hypothetical protein
LFKQVENNPSKKVNTFLKNNIAEKKEAALKVQKQQSLYLLMPPFTDSTFSRP